jgi:hypothetical protein
MRLEHCAHEFADLQQSRVCSFVCSFLHLLLSMFLLLLPPPSLSIQLLTVRARNRFLESPSEGAASAYTIKKLMECENEVSQRAYL